VKDGGASWFKSGDAVRLVKRDGDEGTPWIITVNPGGETITLTAPPSKPVAV
jgi:hypothetical protein